MTPFIICKDTTIPLLQGTTYQNYTLKTESYSFEKEDEE